MDKQKWLIGVWKLISDVLWVQSQNSGLLVGLRCSLEGNWGIEREGVEEHGQRSTEALEEQDRGRGSRV